MGIVILNSAYFVFIKFVLTVEIMNGGKSLKKKVLPFTMYLILAITIVIALFIGVSVLASIVGFNAALNYNRCTSNSGYYCSYMDYSRSGNLTLIFKQNIDANWTGWAIAYVPQGTIQNAVGTPEVVFSTVLTSPSLPLGK